jgi:hypothetical protein
MGDFYPTQDILPFDCIHCSNVATIRQAAEDGHIELASTVLVDTLESYVELVLNALGHLEALVTDRKRCQEQSFCDASSVGFPPSG